MRHDRTRSYPQVDSALVVDDIRQLFGRVEVDGDRIVTAKPRDVAGAVVPGFEDCMGPAVVRGHLKLAYLVCEAAIESNPHLVDEQLADLEAMSDSAERDAAAAWRREFSAELADHQDLRADLEAGPERVFDRAQLTARQRDVMRLFLGDRLSPSKSPAEIAKELGMDVGNVRDIRDRALAAIKAAGALERLAS